MLCLGFEPCAALWWSQMDPVSHGGSVTRLIDFESSLQQILMQKSPKYSGNCLGILKTIILVKIIVSTFLATLGEIGLFFLFYHLVTLHGSHPPVSPITYLFIFSQEGRVYACGEGTNGRLGLSHCNNVSSPRQMTVLSQYVVKKVAVHSGGKHAMALTVDGKVFSWGQFNIILSLKASFILGH